MHRCLLVTELVDIIFEQFAWTDGPGSAPALLSLALTCKAFQQPALNVLWRTIRTPITPIITCLPRDLWERRVLSSTSSQSQLFFRRPIRAEDLTILRGYTSRVRKVIAYGLESEGVSVETFQMLSLASYSPLFPNLRTLAWHSVRDEIFPFIRLFLGGSHLEELLLSLDTNPLRLSLLPYIQLAHAAVKKFMVLNQNSADPIINPVSTLVSGWHHIEHLTCGPLTQNALSHIGQLRCLRTLDITLSVNPVTLPPLAQLPFHALQTLSLTAAQLLPCSDLLKQMISCPVKSLTILLTAATQTSFMEGFFRLLWTTLPLCTSILFYEHYSLPAHFPNDHTIRLDTIRPLFAYSGLVKLTLNPTSSFELDDNALRQLTAAWPQLQTLQLGTAHGWRRRPKLTLRSLSIILANCPELRLLGISIDATQVDRSSTERPGAGVRNEVITWLELSDSRLRDPPLVAAFLSDILPNVGAIHAWDSEEMDAQEGARKYQRRWGEVEKLLKTFAMVREQEKNWIQQKRAMDVRLTSSSSPGMSESASSDEASDSDD